MNKEYRFYNYEQCFAYYANQVMNIRQAKIKGEVILAKPAFLVAVANGIDEGVFAENRFILSEWLERRYSLLMKKYTAKSQFSEVTGIEKPFWHLSTDGFWHLNCKVKAPEGMTPSKKWLKDNVEYAYLDDDLWVLLQNQEWRKKVSEFIIEKKLTQH